MQAFLSIYDLVDWIIRGVTMAAQTLVVGGVAYLLLTLPVLKPGSDERLGLERFSMRALFYSALVLGIAQLGAASALTTFLMGSTQAEFAARIGVPVETVRNWEQGKRSPRGPARALLRMIEGAPEVAFSVLSKKH
jgi:hypothetical protein